MTTLTVPTTIDPAVAKPATPTWGADTIASTLTEASGAIRAAVPANAPAGVRRRAAKLSRQAAAASRLVARGRHLDAPPNRRALELWAAHLPQTAATGDLSTIDMNVASLGRSLVVLHTWRGHTSCVPSPTTD